MTRERCDMEQYCGKTGAEKNGLEIHVYCDADGTESNGELVIPYLEFIKSV